MDAGAPPDLLSSLLLDRMESLMPGTFSTNRRLQSCPSRSVMMLSTVSRFMIKAALWQWDAIMVTPVFLSSVTV